MGVFTLRFIRFKSQVVLTTGSLAWKTQVSSIILFMSVHHLVSSLDTHVSNLN